jgi:uncharacterized membrane protein HdeD (DUF308 family)
MRGVAKELRGLARALMWKGGAMLLLGAAALVWPEQTLVGSLIAVGMLTGLVGLYEVSVALSIRTKSSHWWLVLGQGLASLAFGVLTVGGPVLALRVVMTVIAMWLLAYGGIAFAAASLAGGLRTVRAGLIAWGVLDVLLALLAITYPRVTVFWLLFFGAAYALIYGAWQLIAGAWLAHSLKSHLGREYDGIIIQAH